VPFIARYRKEATGSLDEVVITAIRDRLAQLAELDKRREAILKSLEERAQLTVVLKDAITAAESMTVLEDIYLPYRPKTQDKGDHCQGKGSEPLATLIFSGVYDLGIEAGGFIDPEKGVASAEEALAGARDIIAEWVNEDKNARARIRDLFFAKGVFRTKIIPGKEEEGIKYRDYHDWKSL